jgi:hypothetical protein
MSNNTLIPLDSASVIAAPSSPDASFSNPTSVLHNKTWLLAANEPGYWTASLGFTFTPSRLRLWNAATDDGSGSKSFSFTPLSTSSLSNLSYVDPSTQATSFCSSRCPLAMSASTSTTSFQDYFFVDLVSMNAFRIDIADWYGSEGGLQGIELYGDFQASSTTGTGSSSTISSTATIFSSAPASSSPTDNTPSQNHAALSGGAIAGIVIAVIAALAIGVASLLFWRRRTRRAAGMNEKFVPLGGRHEVDADGVSPAKYREELDGRVVSELDGTPARQEMEAPVFYELPSEKLPT